MLSIRSLSKSYRRHRVLLEVDLELQSGSFNLLLGPNGAGKSTLLRLLAQLERPDAGCIQWNDTPMRPEWIGYLPQDVRFHPLLSVRQILSFYAEIWGSGEEAVRAALVRWGLEDEASKASSVLSGGLRQRLGLATLSLRSPRLLLLDEPDLSLDRTWRTALQAWLAAQAALGAIVIVASHLDPAWWSCAEALWCCEGGRVGLAGPTSPMAGSVSASGGGAE